MKTKYLVLIMVSLLVLAGCATEPVTSEFAVRVGMSRDTLRLRFGEPVRIERLAAGGEDWYYEFSGWVVHPTSESGTTVEFGQQTSYASAGISGTKISGEHAIHLSPEGLVIKPIPEGKVVRR